MGNLATESRKEHSYFQMLFNYRGRNNLSIVTGHAAIPTSRQKIYSTFYLLNLVSKFSTIHFEKKSTYSSQFFKRK